MNYWISKELKQTIASDIERLIERNGSGPISTQLQLAAIRGYTEELIQDLDRVEQELTEKLRIESLPLEVRPKTNGGVPFEPYYVVEGDRRVLYRPYNRTELYDRHTIGLLAEMDHLVFLVKNQKYLNF